MTDQEHTPTDQETALYEAMTAGDWDAVADMGDAVDEAGLEAQVQFNEDHAYAYAHYQADHEAPELERIENTAETVQDENLTA